MEKIKKYLTPKDYSGKGIIWWLLIGWLVLLIDILTRVKDEEFDNEAAKIVKEDTLKKKALDKIGIDESELKEIPPVKFSGYQNTDKTRFGKDNRWRSNVYQVTWLFFSDKQVLMYKIKINLFNGKCEESTEEYFYKDVTNFSTSSDNNWTTFSIIVPGDKFTCQVQGDNIEQSVQAMKQKLREKKA